jgi:sulfoxide reductase heme-binding subunit YedZ
MRKSLMVFGLVTLLSGGTVLAYLWLVSSDEEQMRQMLRISAWAAILIYLVIFVARPLKQLVSSTFSRKLLRNRRYFGIALAAIMSVHLVLLLIVNEQALNLPGAAIFALMYLMLLTSFDSAPAKIGPRNWRILHKTGLYGLGVAYAQSIGRAFLKTPLDPVYLPLALLMSAALAIRIAAFMKTR